MRYVQVQAVELLARDVSRLNSVADFYEELGIFGGDFLWKSKRVEWKFSVRLPEEQVAEARTPAALAQEGYSAVVARSR